MWWRRRPWSVGGASPRVTTCAGKHRCCVDHPPGRRSWHTPAVLQDSLWIFFFFFMVVQKIPCSKFPVRIYLHDRTFYCDIIICDGGFFHCWVNGIRKPRETPRVTEVLISLRTQSVVLRRVHGQLRGVFNCQEDKRLLVSN